ncbi:stage V sporulation protein B [Pelotomaculum terephthalicicum JT]|uniref:stage V sporulation protein B n=1 Tax=Pelotomaculum TaxID=191373 RepID=UPI0009C4BBAF|nr:MULTISPECIES: stage V sporulation protein B [Pelotomaculum]MCG9967643.1 stage V sporulation protein B [Pelotomaculum terephthalicicum JT]OPX84058.1 MAG: Stage V sporulation protein B [Pelotomaculum sp. PtaB.Bin117]OPY60860.1 MAG: Stage V sporulation protein B [Pelotomaculum sp. PtaU1.Bin065]
MAGQSLINGALVLLLSGLFNRIMGFIYEVFMIRLVQPEGIGLFNMIYPAYVLVVVMATAGIPVAIAKLVSEEVARGNLTGAYRIFRFCLLTLMASSAIVTVSCCLGAPLLLKYVFVNPKVYYSFLFLIPGIIIVSLCSAFRGFFQGLQQMKPTALTQSLEQLIRCVSGLIFACILLPKGIEYAAAGASLGVVTGELAGFVSILLIYARNRPYVPSGLKAEHFESLRSIAVRVINLAFPVSLTRIVSTTLLWIDAVLIPQRLLANGMELSEATADYGQFVGISQSLLFAPAIITISLATALLPAISGALAVNNIKLVKTRCADAVRITLIAGIPSTVVYMMLSEELCGLIFGYPKAGASLSVIALGGPFLYLVQTTTGILQGLGKASRPFRNLVIASFFKIAGIYYLTGMPQLGVQGTSAAFVIYFIIMSLLNLIDVRRFTGLKIELCKLLFKPLLAGVGMGFVILLSQSYLHVYTESLLLVTFGAVISGLVIYILILILNEGISTNDLRRLKSIINLKNRN